MVFGRYQLLPADECSQRLLEPQHIGEAPCRFPLGARQPLPLPAALIHIPHRRPTHRLRVGNGQRIGKLLLRVRDRAQCQQKTEHLLQKIPDTSLADMRAPGEVPDQRAKPATKTMAVDPARNLPLGSAGRSSTRTRWSNPPQASTGPAPNPPRVHSCSNSTTAQRRPQIPRPRKSRQLILRIFRKQQGGGQKMLPPLVRGTAAVTIRPALRHQRALRQPSRPTD